MPERYTPRSARVAAVLPVQFRNAGQFLVAYVTNISRGGLFVSTAAPLPVGTQFQLTLEVPGQPKPARLEATVRWTRRAGNESGPAGMGLAFDRLEPELDEYIDQAVEAAAPLHIDLVGRPDRAWRHLESLVRSLVTCSTSQRSLGQTAADDVVAADLVLIDAEGSPGQAELLAAALSGREDRPALVSLCAARAVEARARLAEFGPVVATPVDKEELQRAVLDCLSHARARPPARR